MTIQKIIYYTIDYKITILICPLLSSRCHLCVYAWEEIYWNKNVIELWNHLLHNQGFGNESRTTNHISKQSRYNALQFPWWWNALLLCTALLEICKLESIQGRWVYYCSCWKKDLFLYLFSRKYDCLSFYCSL